MEPQTAQKLVSNSKEIKEFISFVQQEMESLNTIKDIEAEVPELVAIEIKAKKMAYDKLKDILEPLLNVQERSSIFNNKEYVA